MKSNIRRIGAVAVVLFLLLVVSLCANGLLYLRYSTSRPLVTVGNEVITKKQYQDQLENQSGQDVLNKMVMARLIMQAAAKAGVKPTSQDVDAQIAEMERRTPQLLTPYIQDAAKMVAFKQDLAAQIALENLRIAQVAPSSVDARGYYARHQAGLRASAASQDNSRDGKQRGRCRDCRRFAATECPVGCDCAAASIASDRL